MPSMDLRPRAKRASRGSHIVSGVIRFAKRIPRVLSNSVPSSQRVLPRVNSSNAGPHQSPTSDNGLVCRLEARLNQTRIFLNSAMDCLPTKKWLKSSANKIMRRDRAAQPGPAGSTILVRCGDLLTKIANVSMTMSKSSGESGSPWRTPNPKRYGRPTNPLTTTAAMASL